ncbi:MAG: hypothetical protein L0G69_10095 [Brevibacterium sp.]|nr:hypothetical protein [Brevibacterium aurantiacum]MDN5586897.1 hypothetical protein [Brevibacterium sp.]
MSPQSRAGTLRSGLDPGPIDIRDRRRPDLEDPVVRAGELLRPGQGRVAALDVDDEDPARASLLAAKGPSSMTTEPPRRVTVVVADCGSSISAAMKIPAE